MPTIFRPPLITRVTRCPAHAQTILNAEGGVWSNRLLNLLQSQDVFFGAAGMAPDYDYPNPIASRRARDVTWLVNLLENTLAPASTPSATVENRTAAIWMRRLRLLDVR